MGEGKDASRYAVYFAPAQDSALWAFGCHALGYDAYSGADVPAFLPPGFAPERWREIVAPAVVYGWHATLKAPFRLSADRSEDELLAFSHTFASQRMPVVFEGMAVRRVAGATGTFLAVSETAPAAALTELENACVLDFERFRAALAPAEIERRRQSGMTRRQADYFERYGYPYIFDEFRFHMTLTYGLEDEEIEPAHQALGALFAEMVPPGPKAVDGIAIYKQERPGSRFVILERFPFPG